MFLMQILSTYLRPGKILFKFKLTDRMETKRQKQIAELIKRNFSMVLMNEGPNIYGNEVMVSVTSVVMSSDLGLAKIYISIFNTDNKQEILLMMEENRHRLKQGLAQRIRKQIRRIPEIDVYLDDTLDEMYKLNQIFDKINP